MIGKLNVMDLEGAFADAGCKKRHADVIRKAYHAVKE